MSYVPYGSYNGSLDTFSINPENFKLCLAEQNDYTAYYNYDGTENGALRSEEGGGASIKEIDYLKAIDGYATPFNFFVSLHLIAQHKTFMEDVVDAVMKKDVQDPIVFTYIESSSTVITQIDYSGHDQMWYYNITTHKDGTETKSTQAYWVRDRVIDNNNVSDYVNDGTINLSLNENFWRKKEITYYGSLNVTKADTWLRLLEKEITEKSTGSGPHAEEPVNKVDYYTYWIQNKAADKIIVDEETGDIIGKEEWHRDCEINETTTSESSSFSSTLSNKEDKLRVDDFIELINSYPSVKDNLITAPSQMFYFLQQSESTQKMEQVMRYVLYKLSGIDYGVTEESELDNLLKRLYSNYSYVSQLYAGTIQESFGGTN